MPKNEQSTKKQLHHMQHNEKLLIINVIKFFDEEKTNNAPSVPFAYSIKRAAAATGVSESTIKRLRRLIESGVVDSGTSLSPKRRLRAKKIVIDDLSISAIRNKITEFYIDKKEIPSLKKLLTILKEQLNYEGGREHLRKLLLDIGFKFKKCSDKRQIMLERSDIVAARSRYLRRLRCNDDLRDLRRPIIYLDEIYIGPSLTVSKDRQIKDANISEDFRWVIIHTAQCNAFIPGNTLIYNSRSKTGEAHDNIDITTFSKWVQEKIIPTISQPSIIIISNAPYYTSNHLQNLPMPSAKRQVLQKWLNSHQIKFESDMRNAELYELVQQNKPKTNSVIDNLFKSYGHEVINLPAFHGDLNPIEYLWTTLKQKLGTIDKTLFKSANSIAKLVEDAFNTVTSEDWFRQIWNVKNMEWQYWNRDVQMEEEITRLGVTEESDDGFSSDEEMTEKMVVQKMAVIPRKD